MEAIREDIVFGPINLDDPSKDLKDGQIREARNLVPIKDGLGWSMRRQNIKGTTLIANSGLPSGTNRCIGYIKDDVGQRAFYFIKNTKNTLTGTPDDSIYEYNFLTKTVTLIITRDFGFPDKPSVNGGITGDILIWTDGINSRSIDVQRAKDGDYEGLTSEIYFSFHKPQPKLPIVTINRKWGGVTLNKVGMDSWRFAWRWVFWNNEYSMISPWSAVVPAEPNVDPLDIGTEMETTKPHTRIEVIVPSNINSIFLKRVEVLCKKNDEPRWRVWKKIKSGNSLTVTFTNHEFQSLVSEDDVVRTLDTVPNNTETILYHKGRTFQPLTSINKNIDVSSIQILLDAVPLQNNVTEFVRKCVAHGGTYMVGVSFHDDYGRKPPIHISKEITIPLKKVNVDEFYNDNTFSYDYSDLYNIQIALSGEPPDGYGSYQVYVSKEQNYGRRLQCLANVLFYMADEDEPAPSNSVLIDGYYYYNPGPDFTSLANWDKKIHLQLPINLAFRPEVNMIVRIISPLNGESYKEARIIDVVGDKIVVSDFNITNWDLGWDTKKSNQYFGSPITRPMHTIAIEIFEYNNNRTEQFYEVGLVSGVSTHKVTGVRSFGVPIMLWEGDHYWIRNLIHAPHRKISFSFRPLGLLFNVVWANHILSVSYPSLVHQTSTTLESITKPGTEDDFFKQFSTSDIFRNALISGHLVSRDIPRKGAYSIITTLDYNRIATDHGRIFFKAEAEDFSEQDRSNELGFSDAYIKNTLINGLNRYDPVNIRPLSDRDATIIRLTPVGENRMIAIHNNSCTTLYLGEGFLKQADGSDIITKVEGVFGTDRRQIREFGTLHGESVINKDGRIYFYDARRAEFVALVDNGLQPLASRFRIKSWLETISQIVRDNLESSSVMGVYHAGYEMFLWSFGTIKDSQGNVLMNGFTIGLSMNLEGLVAYFDFVPEYLGEIPGGIVSFKSGQIWLHDTNPLRNTFYGQKYPSLLKIIAKGRRDYINQWLGLYVNSNKEFDVILENDRGQKSSLSKERFIKRNDKLYADIMRDENTPNIESPQSPLTHGRKLRSDIIEITITNNDSSELTVDNIVVASRPVRGHPAQ